MPGQPYLIAITCYENDGSTVLANAKVTLRSEATNESLTETSDSSGHVLFNLANLTNGWSVGDKVTAYIFYQAYSASVTHTTTSGGGVDLTLTLVAAPSAPTLRYFTPQDFLDYFNLLIYEDDSENGVRMQQLVKIGEMVEGGIDSDCGYKFDTNSGSYYTVTTEYHDATRRVNSFYTKKMPIYSLTTFEINSSAEHGTPTWRTLTTASEEIEFNSDTGRITIRDAADYPEEGNDQVRITYKYGQTTPLDIKELAILDTAMRMYGASFLRSKIGHRGEAGMNDTDIFMAYRSKIINKYNNTGAQFI